MKKPRVEIEIRRLRGESQRGVRVRGPLTVAVRRAGGYGGIGRIPPVTRVLIRRGLTPPLAKRDRGSAD